MNSCGAALLLSLAVFAAAEGLVPLCEAVSAWGVQCGMVHVLVHRQASVSGRGSSRLKRGQLQDQGLLHADPEAAMKRMRLEQRQRQLAKARLLLYTQASCAS